jgi:hypothetical protein
MQPWPTTRPKLPRRRRRPAARNRAVPSPPQAENHLQAGKLPRAGKLHRVGVPNPPRSEVESRREAGPSRLNPAGPERSPAEGREENPGAGGSGE